MINAETILVLITTFIASITDVKSRIIPNSLLIFASLISLIISGNRGINILIIRVMVAIFTFFVLYIFVYKKGYLPGGDVKALVFLILALGPQLFSEMFGYLAISTIPVMVYYLIRKGESSIPYALPMFMGSLALIVRGLLL